MCFFIDDSDDDSSGGSGSPRLQLGRHHTWLVKRRVLMVVFTLAAILFILGMIFLAIGGGIGSPGLQIVGGIMFGFGVVGIIFCLFICLYAFFFYGTRDQSVQTERTWTDEYMTDTLPGYASIGRPSALKSADSTLKRNGTAGQKKVTMAPEVGPYGESPPHVIQGSNVDLRSHPQMVRSPSLGSGSVYFGEPSDPRGIGGRNVGGLDVGTGGIRITTLDRNQPFPSPGSQVSYGSGQVYVGSGGGQIGYGPGQGHVIYSGGGSSASSVDATYAYPKSVSAINGQESGFSESTSGSQYSTLRSIPVTHIVSDPQRQRHDSLEYARINKQGKGVHAVAGDVQPQRGYLVQGHGHVQSQGQFERQFPVGGDDFDYDNPVERTPMIPPKQSHGQSSYHEKQMQYQREQKQDLYAPRQLDIQTLQRDAAINPYHYQQQQQQQQQQHTQYQSSTSSSRRVSSDELPELQPLVYPSARRPMTFEQVSSSKVSVYDNMLAGLKDDE